MMEYKEVAGEFSWPFFTRSSTKCFCCDIILLHNYQNIPLNFIEKYLHEMSLYSIYTLAFWACLVFTHEEIMALSFVCLYKYNVT